MHSWALKNKHFHCHCALWEKFCLGQGSCTTAASVRWSWWASTPCWHSREPLSIGILEVNWSGANQWCLLIFHVSRWTSLSPQLFILPSGIFPAASHLWRRRDTCLCLAWWDPDLHRSICTLWRHETKARRLGSHCAVKSEPSHQWDLTKAELVPELWDKERQLLADGWVPCLAGNGQQWRTQVVQLSPLPGGDCSSSCTVKMRAAWSMQTG